MKIKQEKQLNLSQLIEWAMENNIKDRMFLTENAYCVGFDRHGFIYFNSTSTMPLDEIFTIEVEEEITEDTVLSKLTCYTAFGFKGTKYNISINDFKSHNPLAFYIMNDDLTMTLIWTHEKGLVE